MIKFFSLVLVGSSKINTEFFDYIDINLRKNNGGVHFASFKFRKLFHRKRGGRISYRTDSKRNQNFVGVKTGVIVAQILGFEFLDRLDNGRRKK